MIKKSVYNISYTIYINIYIIQIDRNYCFRALDHLTLPTRDLKAFQEETLLDGELVWDERKGEMVYYIFDGLMFNAKNLCSMDLNGRLQVIQNDIITPLERRDKSEGQKTVYEAAFPFKMKMKQMWKPYGLQELFERVIPAQGHENDGLIFTPVKDAYMAGTCHRLLKWKPSEMNSIDFLIKIKQAGDEGEYSEGELWIASQGRCHYYCDFDPKLDEKLKSEYDADALGLDDKIAEFRLNPDHPNKWTFMRFRPDKRLPNDSKTVEKVIQSIKDNVRREDLLEREGRIRVNWKARENVKSTSGHANIHINNAPQTQTHTNQPFHTYLVPRSQRIKPPVTFKYPLNLRTEAAKKAYKDADGWLEYKVESAKSAKLIEPEESAKLVEPEESNAERNRESDRKVYCKSEDLCYELEADEEEEKAPRKRIKTDIK